MTYPLYQDRKPICADGEVLRRKDKGAYECPRCNRKYAVPVHVLLGEAQVRRLL